MMQQGRAVGAGLLILLLLSALVAATWWVWSRSAGNSSTVSVMASLLASADSDNHLDDHRASASRLWTLDAQLRTEDGHRVALALSLIRLPGPVTDVPGSRDSDLAAEGFMLGRLVLIPIDAPSTRSVAGDRPQSASQFFQHLSLDDETSLESFRVSRIAAGLAGPAALTADDPGPTEHELADHGLADHRLEPSGHAEHSASAADSPISEILPHSLWVESIRLEQQAEGRWELSAHEPGLALRLQLETQGAALNLSELLSPGASVDPGTSAGQESRDAIRGDWLPRLVIQGELQLDGQPLPVSGQGWLEAASGRVASLLSEGQGRLVADRFVLQLDQGAALMCLRLRRREGGGVPLNNCALVTADAEIRRFDRRDIQLEPIKDADWRSPMTSARYPLRWTLRMPGHAYQLSALRPDRELPLGIPFWSGPLMVLDDTGQTLGYGRMDLTGDPAENSSL